MNLAPVHPVESLLDHGNMKKAFVFGNVAALNQGDFKNPIAPVSASDDGFFIRYAGSAIIVAGYGLAVAQGPENLDECVKQLEAGGISVAFTIHTVTARMPGQMDILLAGADVLCEMVFVLDEIDDQPKTTHVSLPPLYEENCIRDFGDARAVLFQMIQSVRKSGSAAVECHSL